MLTRVSKLADKAILVKLTTRRPRTVIADNALSAKIQVAEGDTSIAAYRKLFQDKSSPINQMLRAVGEVYGYHKTHTMPYVDAGPRILPNTNYFTYTNDVKHHIARVDSMKAANMPHYDQYVQEDIRQRNAGRAGSATIDQYPTAEAFERALSLEYKFSPMPDVRHFLFDLNDADSQACQQAEDDAVALANADFISRMLKPLAALTQRLGEYQGQKGERFHPTIISNVLDGIKEARSLMLFPNEELTKHINELEAMATRYLLGVEMIKGSATVRNDARAKLKEAADTMAAYF